MFDSLKRGLTTCLEYVLMFLVAIVGVATIPVVIGHSTQINRFWNDHKQKIMFIVVVFCSIICIFWYPRLMGSIFNSHRLLTFAYKIYIFWMYRKKTQHQQNLRQFLKSRVAALCAENADMGVIMFVKFMVTINCNLNPIKLGEYWSHASNNNFAASDKNDKAINPENKAQVNLAKTQWRQVLNILHGHFYDIFPSGNKIQTHNNASGDDLKIFSIVWAQMIPLLLLNFVMIFNDPLEMLTEFIEDWQYLLQTFQDRVSVYVPAVMISFLGIFFDSILVYMIISWVLHILYALVMCYVISLTFTYGVRKIPVILKNTFCVTMLYAPVFLAAILSCLFTDSICFRTGGATLSMLVHELPNAKQFPILILGETPTNNSDACQRFSEYLDVAKQTSSSSGDKRNRIYFLLKKSLDYRVMYKHGDKLQFDCLTSNPNTAIKSVFVELLSRVEKSQDYMQHMSDYAKAMKLARDEKKCGDPHDTITDVEKQRECVLSWSGIARNPHEEKRNDLTQFEVQESRIRGALLTCLAEQNTIRSGISFPLYAMWMSLIEWPFAKAFMQLQPILHDRKVKVMWHHHDSTYVRKKLEIAKSNHQSPMTIVGLHVMVFLVLMWVLYNSPEDVFNIQDFTVVSMLKSMKISMSWQMIQIIGVIALAMMAIYFDAHTTVWRAFFMPLEVPPTSPPPPPPPPG